MSKKRPPASPNQTPSSALRIAAIDVGSNSVHMVVAQVDSDGGVTTLWRMKEMVGLGRISFPSKVLSPVAMDRAIASLGRMQQAARQRDAEKIVAVATSAIREADNGGELIERIKRDLGLYVRVVSAREEARLIYLGVRSAMDLGKKPNLIIDIGGGSVEFIVGDATEAKLLDSRKLGAARMTAMFVKSDPITESELNALRAHYKKELTPLVQRITALHPVKCLGTSGTLENIASLTGGASHSARVIDLAGLEALEARLIKSDANARANIRGLDDQRKDQILAGVVMTSTFMRLLKLKRIELCDGALREGILSDYLARHVPDLQIRRDVPDPRRRSIFDLARRCNWYESHSLHVARLAMRLFDELKPLHGLDGAARELIEYGALLHDIGWHISPASHHKHSEYLIRHGALKGFTPREVETIALIARFHRKRPPSRKRHSRYAQLPAKDRDIVDVGSAILRIADGLDRSHASGVRDVKVRRAKKRIEVQVRSDVDAQLEVWAARNKREWLEEVLGQDVSIIGREER
jgi:exopolyphosphatase/guanosine-5'-triphosphate,3'-diphosphate pyrophosphatase